MRRTIPNTTSLTVFEVAARHQSYTKAADELSLTQSAVFRQIASLEEFLSVKLFQRYRRGVVLTDAGRLYAQQVRSRLDEIERDALMVMARGDQGGTLELAVVPTFATKWLIPRLPSFHAEHPDVDVHLSVSTRPFLFDDTPFDAAIHAGEHAWPGTQAVPLMPEGLLPVCSPTLLGKRRGFTSKDWQRCTLLQMSTRPYAWREWFAEQGLQIEGDMAGPRVELFSMAAEAAIHGLGVALVPTFVVQHEIVAERLVTLASQPFPSGRCYLLVYPEQKASNPTLQRFMTWLQRSIDAPPER
ncbi:MAG: LysR substrate-binding domain-containing protein [Methylophilaceae bacterium]|uniref:LysR substrate-binding domain-containing protein n=1 Tax=Methylibium sp. TaxID=2067992 RepID=UPI00359B5F2D